MRPVRLSKKSKAEEGKENEIKEKVSEDEKVIKNEKKPEKKDKLNKTKKEAEDLK